jgi:hypothetical protein
VALFLGWLTPVHAIGPSSSVADDVVTIQMPAVAPPAVQVFLGAYREQGPPEITDSRSFNAAAVRIQQGTSLRFILLWCANPGGPHGGMMDSMVRPLLCIMANRRVRQEITGDRAQRHRNLRHRLLIVLPKD